MELFCFFMGVLFAYTFNYYLILGLLLLFYLTPRYVLVLFFLLGHCVAVIHQWWDAPWGMPKSYPLQVSLQGEIVSLPIKNKDNTQFIFLIKKNRKPLSSRAYSTHLV